MWCVEWTAADHSRRAQGHAQPMWSTSVYTTTDLSFGAVCSVCAGAPVTLHITDTGVSSVHALHSFIRIHNCTPKFISVQCAWVDFSSCWLVVGYSTQCSHECSPSTILLSSPYLHAHSVLLSFSVAITCIDILCQGAHGHSYAITSCTTLLDPPRDKNHFKFRF